MNNMKHVIATGGSIAEVVRSLLLTDPVAIERGLRIPAKPRLLGGSVKINKGEKKGILTTVLYLSPANESGLVDVCPWRTPECTAACLGHSSGQMVFDTSRNARVWKTLLWKRHNGAFNAMLTGEIARHALKARKLGMQCAVRLDGTSDLGLARTFADAFPHVQFYDYTKSVKRTLSVKPPNWHITFSFSGHNEAEALEVLRHNGNVAVVFRTRHPHEFPKAWHGFPVLDADEDDARFLDPPGHVCALTFKGGKIEEAGVFACSVK